MTGAEDFSFGSSCQVHLTRWSHGRVVLVGDAGYCAAPTSGMGTHKHEIAFPAYETQLRPYVSDNQEKGRQAAAMLGGAAEPAPSPHVRDEPSAVRREPLVTAAQRFVEGVLLDAEAKDQSDQQHRDRARRTGPVVHDQAAAGEGE
jgi:hypothetical protein